MPAARGAAAAAFVERDRSVNVSGSRAMARTCAHADQRDELTAIIGMRRRLSQRHLTTSGRACERLVDRAHPRHAAANQRGQALEIGGFNQREDALTTRDG